MAELPQQFSLEISELVLEGVGPYRPDLVVKAIEEELAKLFAGQELPAALLRERAVLVVDGSRIDDRRTGAETGREIARALHRGLTGEVEQ